MEKIRETAKEAAMAAGRILKEKLGNLSAIDYKSAFNIVTDADRLAESAIISIIKTGHPDDEILGEESGALRTGSSRRWIIDPLDGTTNFAHTYPFFCVSIGFEEGGMLKAGYIYNPVTDEYFHAERGSGAWLGDRQLKVSATDSLSRCLLATGFPPDTKTAPNSNLKEFATLTDLCHGVRRDGSAALDLCYVACGRLDGFWEFKLAPWDLAAGVVIVEEAGGKVQSPDGGTFDINSGHVLAANGRVNAEIIEALNTVRAAGSKT